jgi:hypothetical protein
MGFETEMADLKDKREAVFTSYRRQFHELCDSGVSIEDVCDRLEIRYSAGYFWASKSDWDVLLSAEQQALVAKAWEHRRAEQKAYMSKVLGQ